MFRLRASDLLVGSLLALSGTAFAPHSSAFIGRYPSRAAVSIPSNLAESSSSSRAQRRHRNDHGRARAAQEGRIPVQIAGKRHFRNFPYDQSLFSVPVEDISQENAEQPTKQPALDRILSQLTSGFPFFVLFSALIALGRPSLLTWVNEGEIISIMLASVMCGTGLTLEKKDFTNVLQKDSKSVPLGVPGLSEQRFYSPTRQFALRSFWDFAWSVVLQAVLLPTSWR